MILAVIGVFAVNQGVSIAKKADNVRICHRTSSRSNPYNSNTVDQASILSQGHSGNGHEGPVYDVFNDTQTEWGDIIPSFGEFPGYNWEDNAAAQAIWANGCKDAPVTENPIAVISATAGCELLEGVTRVVVALSNDGLRAGEVTINDEQINLMPGVVQYFDYPSGTPILVIDLSQAVPSEIYNDTLVCETEDPELPVGGRGSGTVTPVAETAAPAFSAAVLPQTSATNHALIIGAFSAATALLSVVTKKLYTKFF